MTDIQNIYPFIISGPPAIGKTYLINHLIKNYNYELIPSLTAQLFLKQSQNIKHSINTIISHDKIPVSDLPVSLISQFIQLYPNTQPIFLLPYSIELLEQRMKQRGDDETTIEINLTAGLEEILYFNEHVKHFYLECYTVTQNNFEEIVKDIQLHFSKKS